MNKYSLPYDVYERHKKVGSLIKGQKTVLDVGGEMNHLSQFTSAKKITVANLDSGDVIITKDILPFAKDSFDVATAIDVLEHIPQDKRKKFVKNLLDVAAELVIISFPIGTKRHIEYEKKILEWLKRQGREIDYLKQHVAYGLPTQAEIRKIAENHDTRVIFSGDINLNKLLFKISIFDPHIKIIRKMVYFAKLIFNFLTNPFFYRLLADKSYSENVNRAYLIIKK